ncbi:unnamed protein product, partial [marine sediment metagenome]
MGKHNFYKLSGLFQGNFSENLTLNLPYYVSDIVIKIKKI